ELLVEAPQVYLVEPRSASWAPAVCALATADVLGTARIAAASPPATNRRICFKRVLAPPGQRCRCPWPKTLVHAAPRRKTRTRSHHATPISREVNCGD